MKKFLTILLLAGLFLYGCSSDDEEISPSENNSDSATSEETNEEETETDTEEPANENVLSEVHTYEEEEDIDLEDISINYDGSVVFFNEVDESVKTK